MTYNIMAAPLGLLVGYGLTAIMISMGIDWRWSFLRNSFIVVPVSLLYFYVKPQYLNIGKRLDKQEIYNEEHPVTEQQQQRSDRKMSRFEKLNKKRMKAETKKTADYDFWGRIRYCVSEVDFDIAMLSITSLFVVITGIQFWCTDYFVSVLGLPQSSAYIAYFIVGGFGPIAGVLVGGFVFDKVGGYNGPKALPILIIVGGIASIASMLSVCFNNPYVVASFLTL
jgi:hypothetical protein